MTRSAVMAGCWLALPGAPAAAHAARIVVVREPGVSAASVRAGAERVKALPGLRAEVLRVPDADATRRSLGSTGSPACASPSPTDACTRWVPTAVASSGPWRACARRARGRSATGVSVTVAVVDSGANLDHEDLPARGSLPAATTGSTMTTTRPTRTVTARTSPPRSSATATTRASTGRPSSRAIVCASSTLRATASSPTSRLRSTTPATRRADRVRVAGRAAGSANARSRRSAATPGRCTSSPPATTERQRPGCRRIPATRRRSTSSASAPATRPTSGPTSPTSAGSASTCSRPGVDILSGWIAARPSSTRSSGTSMATPFVSGIAALVLARKPSLSTLALKNAVLNGAVPVAGLDPLAVTGARADALRAVVLTPPDTDRDGIGDAWDDCLRRRRRRPVRHRRRRHRRRLRRRRRRRRPVQPRRVSRTSRR